MTGPVCRAPHHQHPETLCTQPPSHYRRDTNPHAGPLIIRGRQCGSAAWDEPNEQPVTACHHSFPDLSPLGPLHIGDCRHCGITYQQAKAEHRARLDGQTKEQQ